MLDEAILEQIDRGLQRVFIMKVTRTTYREVQNVLMAATKDHREDADALFQSIATGQLNEGVVEGEGVSKLKSIIEKYSIAIRLARDVMERGEFVNLLTSDALNDGNRILFLNRVRRIDGDEFQFVTDPASTVRILEHFANRIRELQKSKGGKDMVKGMTASLENVQKLIGQVIKEG